MFTSCPECTRQYRIHAGQLAAAKGQVRCGYCGNQFNALERLTDEPLPALTKEPTSKVRELRPGPATNPATEKSFEVEPHFEIPVTTPDIDSTSGLATNRRITVSDDKMEDALPYDYPEMLMEDTPKSGSKLGNILWGSGAFILLIVMLAQIAWFYRDDLLKHYPQLTPWAEKLCERLNCEILRYKNISEIKILNRDVRLHPVYSDTLLVNATMVNKSDRVQVFPHIQLSLFDTNGLMSASRKFRPNEYLDNSIAVNKGMRPDQPVHFVLEVTGPTKGAVSFEFRFL